MYHFNILSYVDLSVCMTHGTDLLETRNCEFCVNCKDGYNVVSNCLRDIEFNGFRVKI